MDEKKLKEREALRKAILTAAEQMSADPSIYCGHRTLDDIKHMGRGNAFAWIQQVFQQQTGKPLVPYRTGNLHLAVLDSYQFSADMEEYNQGKVFVSCGGKKYPLWTRSAKAAAENLRKYAKDKFKDVDEHYAKKALEEENKQKKIAQQEKMKQLSQEKTVSAFLPKDGKNKPLVKL